MNGTLISLMTMFFAGSWLSNQWIVKTTTALVQGSSLELILAVSSLAGLAFFFLVRLLGQSHKSSMASWLILPTWVFLEVIAQVAPDRPVYASLGALLFGELIKWHAYSQVLRRFGPLSAGTVLGLVVLAYELGTITASFSARVESSWMNVFEMMALGLIYLPALLNRSSSDEVAHASTRSSEAVNSHGLLPALLIVGVTAGFLKVSADTGFKFVLKLEHVDVGQAVSTFYLVSACFTLSLGVLRRLRWMTPRMGCPKASLSGMALSQVVFAIAMFSGNIYALIGAAALQRSVDKIFYQPTIQLLASGFNPHFQEYLRRWHVTAFLAFGSLIGLVAFSGHKLLQDNSLIVTGMVGLHLIGAAVLAWYAGHLVHKIVLALDGETRSSGALAGSRAMSMLALLSPRHFLVHALIWSDRRGGMKALPEEILHGLTAEAGGEVVETFYAAFPQMDEKHQLALIRLAVFLDRKHDRGFLLSIASEEIGCSLRARRMAAMHIVKVHGRVYRPLLRRSRGKKSPMPATKKVS